MAKHKTLIILIALFLIAAAPGVFAAESVYGYVTEVTATPIENVSVSLYSGGILVANDNTTSTGYYILNFDVGTGLYEINYTHPSFDDDSITKVIVDDQSYEVNRTLGPIATGTISGTVTDTGFVPLANAVVVIEGVVTYTAVTDVNGNYNILVVPGTYNVTASATGYEDGEQGDVVVTDGSTVVVNFQLAQAVTTGTLNGFVFNSTGDGIQDATVQVMDGGLLIASILTNPDGSYSVTLNDGTYNLTAGKAGYYFDNELDVDINEGATTSVNFTLYLIGQNCTESVSYTPWSTCSNKKQSRTATYTNYQNVCGATFQTTLTRSCDSGGSNNDGTSGGSSGAPGVLESAVNICDFSKEDSFEFEVAVLDKVVCIYEGENYTFTIQDITNDAVQMKLFPIPSRSYVTQEDASEIIDLDYDTDNDITVKVSSIRNRLATVIFKLFEGEEEEEEFEEEEEEVITDVVSNLREGVLEVFGEIAPKEGTSPWVGVGVAVLIIAALLLIYFAAKKTWEK
jgi:hypothetical protein